ncbi:Uncharacterized protein FWK35_00017882 [Aphis craccivora]|uniref:Reverse transcriptase domain-containing protein n=1 Tax=Aphis craccivora TaxID=307492 RepID=A0A6G0YAA4_APHCR|nr:Uncharacterized protein FWK35_00017882 [Aphis craccivora]
MSQNNNKMVSPIKIVNNNKTINSQSDEGWTIKQKSKSKRILSSSSEPNSPTEHQPKPRKKIFASANRFNAFASYEYQDSNQMDCLNDNPLNDTDKNSATNTQTANTNDTPIKAPPPVSLKIQTSTPDAYKSLIRFLKEEKAEYHTYQLPQDKPVRVVIRNLHPSTPTSLIISELEFRTHPASYKGCTVYKDLQRRKKPATSNNFFLSDNIRDKPPVVKDSHPAYDTNPNPSSTHAQATSGQSSNQKLPPPAADINKTITSYKLLKANHPDNTAHDGVAILIKSTIAFQVLPNFCQNFLQSSAVLININNIPVTIAALYSPPKHTVAIADFNNYFGTFGNNFIVGGDFNSKHQSWGCLVLTLNDYPLTRPEPPQLFNATTDRYKFHDLVDQKIKLNIKLKFTDDIDLVVNSFTNIIQSAAWSTTSVVNHCSSYQNSLPIHIRTLIVEKWRARALYQRNRLPSLKQKYNNLSNSLKKVLSKNKNISFANHLTNLSIKDGSLWKATKQALQYKASSHPIKNPDGSYASSDVEKSELFKNHLHAIFKPNPETFSLTTTITIQKYLDSPLHLYLPVKHWTPNEVKFTIQKYSFRKSPGFDLIIAEVARCLPKRAITLLTHIFNATLRLSYFPLIWKFSKIILIPKPNKPLESLNSYRPISLLPFFGKILERLLLKRIIPVIFDKKILPDYQFSFRAKHSTIHQVHRVVDVVSYALEIKHYCTCAFLDVSQAFNRVWHEGLLYKLKKFLHPTYYTILKSYLADRHFRVHYGFSDSNIAGIVAGVPQGGILSPILYNIYTSDQPTTANILVADYVDDKVIMSSSPDPTIASENLQIHLSLMED